jgi:hypothetical protein
VSLKPHPIEESAWVGANHVFGQHSRLLVVDSVTSPILIKPATRYHFCHVGAISPVSDDAFSTPARDRFNLLCCPSSSPQLVTTFAVCRFSIMQGVSGLGIIFIAKVCLLLSIQKPDRHFKMGNSFGDAMKPGKFAGANFRRWATKLDLWLTAMDIAYVLKPVDGPLTVEKQVEFDKANVMAVGCILGVLSDNLYDVYMISGRLLNTSTVPQMLDMSSISCTSTMITKWLTTIQWLSKPMRYNALSEISSSMGITCWTDLWQGHYCQVTSDMEGICHISETQEAEYWCSGSVSLSGRGRKG